MHSWLNSSRFPVAHIRFTDIMGDGSSGGEDDDAFRDLND